jgi:hypothetical protein
MGYVRNMVSTHISSNTVENLPGDRFLGLSNSLSSIRDAQFYFAGMQVAEHVVGNWIILGCLPK